MLEIKSRHLSWGVPKGNLNKIFLHILPIFRSVFQCIRWKSNLENYKSQNLVKKWRKSLNQIHPFLIQNRKPRRFRGLLTQSLNTTYLSYIDNNVFVNEYCNNSLYPCLCALIKFMLIFHLTLIIPSQKWHTGQKKQPQQQQNGYSTWDPRKMKSGEVPQYDEIPYGDVDIGHSGKGQLPQVPADYSEVPSVPQRQGTSTTTIFKK